jgi:GDP-L-fucose synthase
MMKKNSKIYVAGHNGMVGSAILNKLINNGYSNIIVADKKELDLTRQLDVERFFNKMQPEYVFLAAAKVGGIQYNNNFPADFIYDNLMIQSNVIDSAYNSGCKKILILGSSCIYPKMKPDHLIREEDLMSGPLEPTNEGYSLAKIAGLKMALMYSKQKNFNAISLMPCNIYGPNDNFNLNECHVIPSMIRKFLNAKYTQESVTLFGDGEPLREFLYVDDLADASVFLMNKYDKPEHINIGSADEYSIKQLASIIANKIGYDGEIFWDSTKPNGVMRRKLDTSKMDELGWNSTTTFDSGLEKTISWYLENGGQQ